VQRAELDHAAGTVVGGGGGEVIWPHHGRRRRDRQFVGIEGHDSGLREQRRKKIEVEGEPDTRVPHTSGRG
jgi:hypothetical protein